MSHPKYHMDNGFNLEQAHPDDAHSILMRHIPAHSQVLELGCATGYLSAYMEQALGCQVIGLEYDSASSQIAQQYATAVYNVDLDQDDALSIVRDHAPFDVVLAAAVLEHLKYPERLLRALHPLLEHDALVIVSLPNIAYWQMRLRLLRGKFDYEDYGVMDRTHLKLYTRKTGRELLENANYQVIDFQIAGSLLQQWANKLARMRHHDTAPLILPELLAYELIYFAKAR